MLWSPLAFNTSKQFAGLALAKRLPLISLFAEFPKAGGLMAYGPDVGEIFRRCGDYVGEDPTWRQAKRIADTAAGEVRSGDQPQDGRGARP